MMLDLETLKATYRENNFTHYTDALCGVTTVSGASQLTSDYATPSLAYGLIQPLISMIRDYDSRFKSQHQALLEKLPSVLNKDNEMIQSFKEILTDIAKNLEAIKSNCVNARSDLAKERDALAETIRKIKGKLDELAVQKSILNDKRALLEREIHEVKVKIAIYEGLDSSVGWILPIIPQLYRMLVPFESELKKVLAEIGAVESDIAQIYQEGAKAQKSLHDSTLLFNTNQELINRCDAIRNHIESLKTALEKVNVDGYFLKAKLGVLQSEWFDLMGIANHL